MLRSGTVLIRDGEVPENTTELDAFGEAWRNVLGRMNDGITGKQIEGNADCGSFMAVDDSAIDGLRMFLQQPASEHGGVELKELRIGDEGEGLRGGRGGGRGSGGLSAGSHGAEEPSPVDVARPVKAGIVNGGRARAEPQKTLRDFQGSDMKFGTLPADDLTGSALQGECWMLELMYGLAFVAMILGPAVIASLYQAGRTTRSLKGWNRSSAV